MWPEHQSTLSQLEHLRAGDPDGLNRLLNEHRGALRKMIELRLDPAIRARVDASDVVQDVMLEAAQRMQEFLAQSTMPFHTWLRLLARDRMIDMHRRHRQSARRSVDRERRHAPAATAESTLQLIQLLEDGDPTPAAAALQHELRQQFMDAINRLDESDRELILMRHVEQLTNSQVAELLGLSQPAAGMRYLRALRRLRSQLSSSIASFPGQQNVPDTADSDE